MHFLRTGVLDRHASPLINARAQTHAAPEGGGTPPPAVMELERRGHMKRDGLMGCDVNEATYG